MRLTEEQYQALIGRNTKGQPVNKFGAKRTNGYDSKGEHDRGVELERLQAAGQISNLRRQVKYPLCVADECIGFLVADFVYVENGKDIVEDFKGVRTPLFRWKARHFRAQYGFPITEVRNQ